MATLYIEIDLDNDAFQPEPFYELSLILEALSARLTSYAGAADGVAVLHDIPLRDSNGNRVGEVTVSE